jgi:hypothetical protein
MNDENPSLASSEGEADSWADFSQFSKYVPDITLPSTIVATEEMVLHDIDSYENNANKRLLPSGLSSELNDGYVDEEVTNQMKKDFFDRKYSSSSSSSSSSSASSEVDASEVNIDLEEENEDGLLKGYLTLNDEDTANDEEWGDYVKTRGYDSNNDETKNSDESGAIIESADYQYSQAPSIPPLSKGIIKYH